MDKLDKFQQLVSDCSLVIGILGNPALDTFEVLEVTSGSLAEMTRREDFVGLVGFSGVEFDCALAVPLDDPSISVLTQVFIDLVARALKRLDAEYLHKHRRHDWSELT